MLCLTVCGAPVLAGNEQYTDGFFYWSNGGYVEFTSGSTTVNMLNGYFPATFSVADGTNVNGSERDFAISGKFFKFSTSVNPTVRLPDMYVELLFPVPGPLTVTASPNSGNAHLTMRGRLGAMWNGNTSSSFTIVGPSQIFSVYDDKYFECEKGSSDDFYVPIGDYDIKRYFGFKYVFPATSKVLPINNQLWGLQVVSEMFGNFSFTDPDYVAGIYDEVQVNTGILQEINGTLTEIKTSTATIQNDVSEIKDGLQDSNSGIWGAFKDSVSGLFVPSAEDLTGVKDGFDQLAQDKLGGAYQSVDLVKNGVSQVRDKMNNPNTDFSVEFPGIDVPLGEMYGTVHLIGRQDVTIPQKMRDVLYPIAGIIIPIVCTTWTVRLGIDMVNCFMSGMSYAQFLHRFMDEEDDEA